MTRATGIAAFNCTSCGAGLNVLGGGRVLIHICPYCGAELDAQNDYKLIKRHKHRKRPASPFELGMTGRLHGVEWTIIGTIGQHEEAEHWVEHQLYSPTHGYAWLTVEDGHTTFSRRMRKPSHPAWITYNQVERAENRPGVRFNGGWYQYFCTTDAVITYLEGEFTWAPRMGERSRTISMLLVRKEGGAMLDYSVSGAEREMYRSTYLDPVETAKVFGAAPLPAPRHVHPLQPQSLGGGAEFYKAASIVFAVISLVAAFAVFSFGPAREVLPTQRISLSELPRSFTFDVTDTERLVQINMSSMIDNAWLYVEFEVVDPEDETLFEAGREMEFYSGYEDGERWSEGRNNATMRFRPSMAGTYELIVAEQESELWTRGTTPRDMVISVKEGVPAPSLLMLLAGAFGAVGLLTWGGQLWRRRLRWAQSDWEDD